MLDKEQMVSAFPKDSAVFDSAVDSALRQIHNQAVLERQAASHRQFQRVLSWGLGFVLLLAGAFGIAEGIRLGVFDFLLGREDVLPQATELVQQDLAEMQVGHTTLRVTEAVYDGAMVRFVMSVQNDTIQRTITEQEANGDGDFGAALSADGVTAQYSFDWFTIDGTEYGMTGGSGGETIASANNGEALIYFELLLSEDDSLTAPTSDFTLGVPVRTADTREAQQMFIPIKVIATNLLRNVKPSAPTTFGEGDDAYAVTIVDAKLSPIRNVIELRVDVPDTMDENAAWECVSPWYAIALVDETGAELGSGSWSYYGLPEGETDEARHFIIRMEFAPVDSYPDTLYIAPVGYGENGEVQADMSHAIELNEGRFAE